MLELREISKAYSPGTVREMCLFNRFSLTIRDGSFVSVVGGNGSGKTSLLNLLCGSITPDDGQILMDGKDITRSKEYQRMARIGRIHQNPAAGTCAGMTILENLSLADHKKSRMGLKPCVDRSKAEAYRELLRPLGLGLENMLSARCGTLSGGQRQALTLVMATMTPIDYLILDEHTAALDPRTAETIMQLTERVVRDKKLTALMVTHNLRYALSYGDRLLMLNRGRIALDAEGEDKKALSMDRLLDTFNTINLEAENEAG